MMNIIETENLSKQYRQGELTLNALSGINIKIPEKAFAALLGPSGSGKSTLLNIFGLIDQPTEGKLTFCGQDISHATEKELTTIRRHQLGFIFQGFNLVPVMTVFDNVEYPLTLLGLDKKTRDEKVNAMLERVGISQFKNHLPDQISGGQKQRVAIARALITQPKLVIADEPTANLDTQTATGIIELMYQMHQDFGTSFIIATHDERMSSHCHTSYQLHDGVLQ
ncbi:Lipoprotein releasing system ATP-binding protein LolD [hydrothermal vent metagenome]|uniref:Lipoprotein releasing system ATP-binding protein LolD n=1 Tax=hydrothermal vent metagenome TaxID=652676 RepID=A0A3B0ZRD4_9ZZZZ